MIKRAFIVFAIIIMMVPCLYAQAPAKGIYFYANSGISLPIQPTAFSDYWKSGANFGFGAGYDLSKYVNFQGYFEHNTFGFNTDKFKDVADPYSIGIEVTGGSFKILTVMANVKASFIARGNKVVPYFVGGIGLFSMSQDDVEYGFGAISYTLEGESKSTLASSLGFGVDVMVTEMVGLFAEFKSAAGAVELKTDIPDTEDGIVGYVPFKIGVIVQL